MDSNNGIYWDDDASTNNGRVSQNGASSYGGGYNQSSYNSYNGYQGNQGYGQANYGQASGQRQGQQRVGGTSNSSGAGAYGQGYGQGANYGQGARYGQVQGQGSQQRQAYQRPGQTPGSRPSVSGQRRATPTSRGGRGGAQGAPNPNQNPNRAGRMPNDGQRPPGREGQGSGSGKGGKGAAILNRLRGLVGKARNFIVTHAPSDNRLPGPLKGHGPLVLLVAIIIALLLIIVIISSACSAFAGGSKKAATETDTTEVVETVFTPSPSALDALSGDATLQTFSLSSEAAPTLSDEQTAAIEEAIAAVEAAGDVGIVFYDVETGLGISYNVDAEIYGASTFKAPYALYLCEDLIEGGVITLDDVSSMLETSIIYSSGDDYITLRDTYDSVDFDAWVTALGASDAVYLEDSHYPWYCTRSSAKLWTELYLYLQTGTDTAVWLEDLLGQTETSFIRNAVEDTGASVINKAGWISYSDEYNSVSDAGIVTLNGHTYIMCIMTYMAYSEDTQALYETLAAAVFDTHDVLSGTSTDDGEDASEDASEDADSEDADNDEEETEE